MDLVVSVMKSERGFRQPLAHQTISTRFKGLVKQMKGESCPLMELMRSQEFIRAFKS